MGFSEFVSRYKSGTVSVEIDQSQAVRVCSDSPALPRRFRTTHLLRKNISLVLVLGGLVALLWAPWWAGLGATVVGIFVASQIPTAAARFVLQHSLEDETFFLQMRDCGVLSIARTDVLNESV